MSDQIKVILWTPESTQMNGITFFSSTTSGEVKRFVLIVLKACFYELSLSTEELYILIT